MPHRIDQIKAWAIVTEHNRDPDVSLTQIARRVGHVSRSGVTAVLARFRNPVQPGNPMIPRGNARPTRRKLSPDQIQVMIDYVENNPFATPQQIKTELNLVVSNSTVCRRLREAGIKAHRPARKPRLTLEHKLDRLLFCQGHLNDNFDWHRVFFSDESTVSTAQEKGVDWVRRRRGQRYEEEYLRKTAASGRVSVHVWAGITREGPTELVRIKGKLNAKKYVMQILSRHVKPFFSDNTRPDRRNCYFQQDNSSVHRAIHVQTYLNRVAVPVMKWPACSPDLSPIENYWQLMKTRVGNVQFQGSAESRQDQLWEVIKRTWDELRVGDGPRFCASYFDSMDRRIRACIAANGGSTKY